MTSDIETATSARQQYTWQGNLEAYVIEASTKTTTVPNGNPNFDLIQRRIEEGQCKVLPPAFLWAFEVVGRRGRVTGHNTAIGFVPADPENRLRQLLDQETQNGKVENRGRAPKPQLPQCSHVKFCVFFDTAWPHLIGPLSAEWRYRSSNKDTWVCVGIRLSNLSDSQQPVPTLALSKLGIADERLSELIGEPLQQAMLEIEFNVVDLWRLYRSESRMGFGWSHDMIEDNLTLSLVRDDREGDAPDTRTLIGLAPLFLRRAVTDIANNVSSEFNFEYGGNNVGFLKELDLQEQHLCLLRDETQKHSLLSYGRQPSHSFQLAGEWKAPEKSSMEAVQLTLPRLSNRIRALINAGFAPEALTVANGFFEIVCRQMLAGVIAKYPTESNNIITNIRFGYDRIMNILRDTLNSSSNEWIKRELLPLFDTLEEIYKKRNAYVHALTVLEHDFTRSVDLSREASDLLSSLISVWETGKMARAADSIIQDGGTRLGDAAVEKAIIRIKEQICNSFERTFNGLNEMH